MLTRPIELKARPHKAQGFNPGITVKRSLRPLGTRALPALLLLLSANHLNASPHLPGLNGKHPLDAWQQGQLLAGELRCAACHDGVPQTKMKEAPDLNGVGTRLNPGYIQAFLENPAKIHPGTTMPSVLPQKNRKEVAKALTAFLMTLQGNQPPRFPKGNPEDGNTLYHETGCVACHGPMEAGKGGNLSLNHIQGKYQPDALEDFLHAPLATRPSGRMPDMKLSKSEAASIASFLEKGQKPSQAHPKPEKSLFEAGKEAFMEHGCFSCHKVDGITFSLPDLVRGKPSPGFNLSKGCLSPKPSPAPDYQLTAAQIDALRTYLHHPQKETTPEQKIESHLTRLNCIACHQRNGYGGVDPALDKYFHSTEEALGNESRIPPQLTLAGAKLRPEWLDQVLHNGKSIRPYMKARMPQFGEAALHGLPQLLAKADKMKPVELPPPGRSTNRQTRDAAQQLLGDKGLNCIACHNYNGKPGPGLKGLDLMTTYQRLQPAWYYSYMQNPASFRPGILMPSYWPGGKAVQTEILGGDTHEQLRALWFHFSLGRSARDPSGLQNPPLKLEVTEKTPVYRGRSSVAGYRGIAVGFPGGMNYAFNAKNGALTALWRGEFVSVGWRGQGAGNFNPAARAHQLAQDVAFLQGGSPPGKWPLRPRTSKEQPVDPDPLYPKNHGYQFQGYTLGDTGTPTFRYQCGDIAIQDHTKVAYHILVRKIHFNSPKKQTLHFRPLTGKIQKVQKYTYQSKNLRLTLHQGTHQLRPLDGEEQELLVQLDLPQGKTTITLEYELSE